MGLLDRFRRAGPGPTPAPAPVPAPAAVPAPARGDDGEPTRFFVAHMQKTAGTALRDRLRATFADREIYPNPSDGEPRHAVISVRHLQERWTVRGDDIRLLTGHFPLRTPEVLGAPFVTLTVLRDPVDRTLSFLRHQAQRNQRGATVDSPLDEIYDDEFRREAMVRNHMVRTLSLTPEEWGPGDGVLTTVTYDDERLEMAKAGLRSVDLFGLQDRFDHLCDELAATYGLRIEAPLRTNTTDPTDVPAGLVDRILEDNALDVELYRYARALHDERHPDLRTAS